MKVKIKIKEILNKRGMTQKELANMTKLRESTISDFVRGVRTVVNIQHLECIADALDIVDIRDLIDFVDDKDVI